MYQVDSEGFHNVRLFRNYSDIHTAHTENTFRNLIQEIIPKRLAAQGHTVIQMLLHPLQYSSPPSPSYLSLATSPVLHAGQDFLPVKM